MGTEDGSVALDPRSLDVLGRAVADAVGRVAADGLGDAARAIAAALPGTRSAAAAQALAGRWDRATAWWADAAVAHGGALRAAAGAYAATDSALAGTAQQVGAGLSGPAADGDR